MVINDSMDLQTIKSHLVELKEKELKEILDSKASHYKFAHILLASQVLTNEITPEIKKSITSSSKDQLSLVPSISDLIDKCSKLDVEFVNGEQILIAEILMT